MARAALALALAAALAAAAVLGRPHLQRHLARLKPAGEGQGIEVLAVRALSGKQRLALVETCGERLLIAATDREVTLLSHLPAAEPLAPLPAAPLHAAPARDPSLPISADVRGLLDLTRRDAQVSL